MKAHLMYPDRDFDVSAPPPPLAQELVQDLELQTLFAAMADEDKVLAEVVRAAILDGTDSVTILLYRQAILRDCIVNEAAVREIYALVVETLETERKNYLGVAFRYPGAVLHRSVEVLQMLTGMLRRLREIATREAPLFRSEGFRNLFAMLIRELDDDYFARIQDHFRRLRFRSGVLVSAALGEGNVGIDYVLRRPNAPAEGWLQRIFGSKPRSYAFRLSDRDEAGARALSLLRDRGINLVANALGQSTDHVSSFFNMLRLELAFYIGCLNLRRALLLHQLPIAFPTPSSRATRRHQAKGLYDVCLALRIGADTRGNDLDGDGRELMIVTGANQGGKSTFLRSVGQAQVMMQCGMFVAAGSFAANTCARVLTHYKREEDSSMASGKFDEELSRMSAVVDAIEPDTLVLFNESFAATNEREGSAIGREIITVLLEHRVKMVFVTHQYELAAGFLDRSDSNVLFLRAQRRDDGERTFRIAPGAPERTSHGEDLYRRIFTEVATAEAATADS